MSYSKVSASRRGEILVASQFDGEVAHFYMDLLTLVPASLSRTIRFPFIEMESALPAQRKVFKLLANLFALRSIIYVILQSHCKCHDSILPFCFQLITINRFI